MLTVVGCYKFLLITLSRSFINYIDWINYVCILGCIRCNLSTGYYITGCVDFITVSLIHSYTMYRFQQNLAQR